MFSYFESTLNTSIFQKKKIKFQKFVRPCSDGQKKARVLIDTISTLVIIFLISKNNLLNRKRNFLIKLGYSKICCFNH